MGVIIPFIIVDRENNFVGTTGYSDKTAEDVKKINKMDITIDEKIELVRQLLKNPPHYD